MMPRMRRACSRLGWMVIASAVVAAADARTQAPAQAPAPPAPFRNLNASFHIAVPDAWRQLAPNEARTLANDPRAPSRLCLAQPRHFYAVGPVAQWLAGDFRGPWLYVVEQPQEWYVSDTFADDLRAMWAAEGAASGERHELHDIRRAHVGAQQVEVVMARRVTHAPGGRPPVASLDVHAPNGGRQLTLSFCCPPAEFDANEASFHAWLQTLTFARIAKGQASLGDRLLTPLLVGGLVGIVLLVLYKHTRARR
jgi:hypothetical protein